MNAAPMPSPAWERIRIRGIVQGVGFRPTVWRIANTLGVRGRVSNDGDGVIIEAWADAATLERFVHTIRQSVPPLSRIDAVERMAGGFANEPAPEFLIVGSRSTGARTHVPPDAGACPQCAREALDPFARRFRYPFANCTHCGPRLSIVERMPYDRENTTMAGFTLCPECLSEYQDPADRRFHAQPIGCHRCGPKVSLVRADGRPMALDALTSLDEVDAGCTLLQRGAILAIKGIGGYQLACDATNEQAVRRLRSRKRRERKPFALMARDLAVTRSYAEVSEPEARLLSGPEAPIVLLERADSFDRAPIAEAVAPGVRTLGFMLPNTPLHHLLLRRMDRPIVLTSGNLSEEPQIIDNEEAHQRLADVAEYFLDHNRQIARRVDDSVVRLAAARPRIMRRGRGFAPTPLALPPGFENAPPVLAMGGELKNTFCLLRGGEAILSSHIGDLQDARTLADYEKCLADFQQFYEFRPRVIACDLHPNYQATRVALSRGQADGTDIVRTQHHHAHIAACLAENGVARESPPVLGVALDGLGYGEDGTLWGGEFLLADYAGYRRLATFKPVALPGGEAAVREPWRNTYAHLMAEMGWAEFAMNYSELELFAYLSSKPLELLNSMLTRGLNSPLASSCGRLFDAVAAAVGLARDRASFEGQGAMEFEASVDRDCLENEEGELDYPFAIPKLSSGLPYVEPLAMWQAVLGDLCLRTPPGVMAARFHRGLARVIVRMIDMLAEQASTGAAPLRTVALSGGVFQNRILLEQVLLGLNAKGLTVLTHSLVPSNDGGLSFGQAVIAAARRAGS